MIFEISVTQFGNIKDDDKELQVSCTAIVAIFIVEANSINEALSKTVKSKDFQNIEQVESLGVSMKGEMPTYYLKKDS